VALSGRSLELPGPFGERNTLGFHPRGTAWLVAATELERCAQLACALATGNRALLTDSESTRAFVQALPPAVRGRIDLAADPLAAAPDAVLFDGTPAESTAIREQLVLREGPIAPMLHRDPDYDVTRLVTERCVSVNTAAAGGNAQLMGELD